MIGDAVGAIIPKLADFCRMSKAVESDNITIDETTCFLIEQSIPRTRAMQHKGRCRMVIIDHLQLVSVPPVERRPANREREVAEISYAAKLLAKELNIPVLLLAQLSRKVEERTDKMPLPSDLRASGAIEQDADIVIFIDRPVVYSIREFDGGKYGMIDARSVGLLTIAKNSEGYIGFIPFCYKKPDHYPQLRYCYFDHLKSE